MLCRYNPFSSNLGIERFVSRLSIQLASTAHQCEIFCGGPRDRVTFVNNVALHEVGVADLPFLGTFQFNRKLASELTRPKKRGGLIVVNCHGSGPASAYTRLNRIGRSDMFLVYHAHDCVAAEMRDIRANKFRIDPHFLLMGKLLSKYEKAAVLGSDKVVAVSNATKKALISFYKVEEEKIDVIGLGIPDDYPVGIETVDPAVPCFLTFGAGNRRDIASFLEAMRILRELHGLNAAAIIVRDYDKYHRTLARQLRLQAMFMDELTEVQLKQVYGSCTSLVIHSLREGFCLPVIEAAAFGKPTIATSVGSLPELIEHERTGLLLDDLEPSTLANSMYKLATDLKTRQWLGRNARDKARDFTISSVAQRFLQLCQRLGDYDKRKERAGSMR